MTTEEIKNLIDQKIAGQGTMVDVGGALPTILKEIVDMASEAKPQEQADYAQTDNTEVDFIKNKPIMIFPEAQAILGDDSDEFCREIEKATQIKVGTRYFHRLNALVESDDFKQQVPDAASEQGLSMGYYTDVFLAVERFDDSELRHFEGYVRCHGTVEPDSPAKSGALYHIDWTD